MQDEESDNSISEDENIAQYQDDEYISEDAKPLCPQCLEPCNPLQYYCNRCGSNETINPLASCMPYLRIRFNLGMVGKALRRAWCDKETPMPFRILCAVLALMYILIVAN